MVNDDVDDFLAHFGKKGMKWGVTRTDDQLARASGSSKEGVASTKKSSESSSAVMSKSDAKKAIDDFYKNKSSAELQAEGKAKLKAQSDMVYPSSGKAGSKKPSDTDPTTDDLKRGLSRNQKIALGVGAAVAVSALAYYGNKTLKDLKEVTPFQAPPPSTVKPSAHKKPLLETAEQQKLRGELDNEMAALFGPDTKSGSPGAGEFYVGLINKKALDRPEFTIPKSTTFQRLSNHPETGEGYTNGTYATFLSNDKRSYGGSGEFGKKKYTLTFEPTKDIKVPSTLTVLTELKKVGGHKTDAETYTAYHNMAGGSWKDANSVKLIGALKAKGYSAIVDDMDAGYLGDLPVVFFGETKQVNAKPRTYDDKTNDKASTLAPGRHYS